MRSMRKTGIRVPDEVPLAAGVLIIASLMWGCVPEKSNWPVIERPERPVLEVVTGDEVSCLKEDTFRKIRNNSDKLQVYAKKMEAEIDKYNEIRKGK